MPPNEYAGDSYNPFHRHYIPTILVFSLLSLPGIECKILLLTLNTSFQKPPSSLCSFLFRCSSLQRTPSIFLSCWCCSRIAGTYSDGIFCDGYTRCPAFLGKSLKNGNNVCNNTCSTLLCIDQMLCCVGVGNHPFSLAILSCVVSPLLFSCVKLPCLSYSREIITSNQRCQNL